MDVEKQVFTLLAIIATGYLIYALVPALPYLVDGVKHFGRADKVLHEIEAAGNCDVREDCVRIPVDCTLWSSWVVNRTHAVGVAELIHQKYEHCIPTDELSVANNYECINNTCSLKPFT